MGLGDRIIQRRKEKRISAAELARRAEISKSYLSEIEGNEAPRPSADVLFRIADSLGTTIADLLEKEVRPMSRAVSPSLKQFATEYGIPEEDIQMLARIRFRGEQPSTPEDWRFLYESVKRSISRNE